MENLVFTQLSIPEIRLLFRKELESFFGGNLPQLTPQPEPDQIFTAQETADFLGLALPTIYTKSSRGEIPGSKRGKRLYFSRRELTEWVKQGRRKTGSEIEAEALTYLNNRKRRG